MKPLLVIFDMAGTTINDEDGVNRSLRDAMAAAGITVTAEEVNEVMGIPKPLAIARLIEQSSRPHEHARLPEIYADFAKRIIAFYETDGSVREIAGAGDVFARLRAADIRVALNTGFSRAVADVVLTRLGWHDSPHIDATVTSDEVEQGRPHPDMIRKLIHALAVDDIRRVCKVGDTPSDLYEGKNAGCGMVVGVTGGSHTEEQLRHHPHTHLIGTVAELPALLGID